MSTGALQRAAKTLFVERLQQIVERMRFESLDRIMIVGSGEDDDRRGVRRNLAQNAESVNLGHFDV